MAGSVMIFKTFKIFFGYVLVWSVLFSVTTVVEAQSSANGSYLCIMKQTTGFRHVPGTDLWLTSQFSEQQRYIIRQTKDTDGLFGNKQLVLVPFGATQAIASCDRNGEVVTCQGRHEATMATSSLKIVVTSKYGYVKSQKEFEENAVEMNEILGKEVIDPNGERESIFVSIGSCAHL